MFCPRLWLATKERGEQRITKNIFKYWKGNSPFCVNELLLPSRNIYKTRSHMALEIPLNKCKLGHKNISFIGQSIWHKLSNGLE